MFRVILFLAFAAVLAFGAVWMADRPGEVAIVWQGYRIETSTMVLATAVVVLVVLAVLIWSLFRTILRSPDLISMYLGQRRGIRGYLAISRGLVAVGAGDGRTARRFAGDAERIAPGDPLALLLNAQVAQLEGNRADAEAAFRAMAEREDTKLLGLRGLFVEARRRDDAAAARLYAEEAARTAPALGWAGQAVLEFRSAAGDWTGALAALDRNSKHALVDRAEYRRQRAVLLTAQALAADEAERERALPLALEAVKLSPSLVPAAELAGRLLGEAGELRKASRIVEKAWEANPHPDLAETYAHLRPGDSARERLTRVQRLADRAPGHPESALAVTRAALDAQEFAAARAALRPLLKEPTQRVAALMAEIEMRESGDEGRAREWMGRALRAARDPAWTADGFVSGRWLPVSPVDGRLDAFQWKVPLGQLTDAREVIEIAEEPAAEMASSPPLPEPAPEPAEKPAAAAPPPVPVPASEAPAAPPSPAPAPVRPVLAPVRPPAPARPEPVIPMVHAPDDPGPDAAPEFEPRPEPAGGAGRLRLFK